MSYSFANIKILIVDDEELIREILSEAFTLYGGSVDLAESGFEAINKIHGELECNLFSFLWNAKNRIPESLIHS